MSPPGRRAVLIAIEGIDGSGKSTVVRSLARRWRARGLRVAVRREPTDRAIGRRAAELSGPAPWTAAILFTVDRALSRVGLERAIERSDRVIQDRSFYSTIAYQGSALAPSRRRRLARLENRVALRPDRVVLLDLDPEVALARLRGRRRPPTPFEQRTVLRRVAGAYRRLARSPDWTVVRADAEPHAVADAVDLALSRVTPAHRRRNGGRNLFGSRPRRR